MTSTDEFNAAFAQSVAKTHGISIEAAKQRLDGQVEFAHAATKIKDMYPHEFVTARWEGSRATSRIYVKDAQRVAAALQGVSFTVAQTPDAIAEEDRTTALQGLSKELGTLKGVDAFELAMDPFTQAVTAKYASDTVTDADVAQVLSRARTRQHPSKAPSITVVRLKNSAPEASFGSGGNMDGCTAGWVHHRSGKIWAVSTADHCSNQTWYDGAYLDFDSRLQDRDGDAQVFRVSKIVSGKPTAYLRWDFDKQTPVKGAADPTLGMDFCKFGVTTGRTCSYVTDTTVCVEYRKPVRKEYCNQIQTHGKTNWPGDSGGPMYANGAIAMGLVSGSYHGPDSPPAPIPTGESSWYAKVSAISRRLQFYIYAG